jgi:hypothetical protein
MQQTSSTCSAKERDVPTASHNRVQGVWNVYFTFAALSRHNIWFTRERVAHHINCSALWTTSLRMMNTNILNWKHTVVSMVQVGPSVMLQMFLKWIPRPYISRFIPMSLPWRVEPTINLTGCIWEASDVWCSTLKWLLLLSLCTVLCWHVEVDSIPTYSTSTTLQNNNQQNFPAYNTNLWWPPFSTSIHHPLHLKATLIRTL